MIISERRGLQLQRRGERSLPSVHVGATMDKDAISFLKHIGVKDVQIVNAFNDAVWQIKQAGLWTKIFTWYPFIGGNSHAHSHNAKAFWQFQATYNGSPAHTYFGIDFTVNTQYMDFGFSTGSLSQFSNTISFYCNRSTANALNRNDLGARNGTTQQHILSALLRLII